MLKVIKKVVPKNIIAENVQKKTIEHFKKQVISYGYRAHTLRIGADEIGADHTRNRWFCVAHTDNQSKFSSRFNGKMALLPKLFNDTWGYENFSRILRVSNGVSNRAHRLKSLGNAIVPQCVVPIMQAIKELRTEC